jgi:hypothetical protein
LAAVNDVRTGSELIAYSFDRVTGTFTLEDEANLGDNGFSVDWHPSIDYIAVGRDSGPGGELQTYSFTRVGGTLTPQDSIGISGAVNAVAWYKNGDYLAVGTSDASAYLRVYQFSITGGTLGALLTVDRQPDGIVSIDALDWDVTGSYLAVGITNLSGPELLIYYLQDSSNMTLTCQLNIPNVTTARSLDWSKTDSLLAVGLENGSEKIRIYRFDNGELGEITNARVNIDNTILSIAWSSTGDHLAVGSATDTFPELQVYDFEDGQYLHLDASKYMGADVNVVRWDYNNTYLATGDSAFNLTAFRQSQLSPTVIESLYFENVHLRFDGDISWRMTTTFGGTCSIDAKDNALNFQCGGGIRIASGATLTIKNAFIKTICGLNIAFEDDTASLVLRNVSFQTALGFRFSTGSILFEHDVVMTGTNYFEYASRRTSTIAANSMLMIHKDFTFTYAPPIANRDLIYMEDKSSSFRFCASTLKSTTTGMRITRGRLFFDNHITLSSASINPSESICFGDGTADNDLDIKLLSGANLEIHGGVYINNVA